MLGMSRNALLHLETVLRCPVCLEDYSGAQPPVTLGCGHNLCTQCTRKLTRRRSHLQCPIDKQRQKVLTLSTNDDFLKLIERIRGGLQVPVKRAHEVASSQCAVDRSHDECKQQCEAVESEIEGLQDFLTRIYLLSQCIPALHPVFSLYN